MRYLFVLTVVLLNPAVTAWGDDQERPDPMLARWMLFGGPTVTVKQLVPDADPQSSCILGTLLFACPQTQKHWNDAESVGLKSVVPAAEAFKIAKPDAAIKALINLHMSGDHYFSLSEVELLSREDYGYRWNAIWVLNPIYGGSTGVPFRYRAAVTPRGKLIVPDRYQFDTYVLKGNQQRLCSILKLEFPKEKETNAKEHVKQVKLTQQQIEERGTEAFDKFLAKVNVDRESMPLQFEYMDCRAIDFPMSVGENGKIQSIKAWGVNFKEVLGPDERKKKNFFTVWLTEAGTLSELKVIPVGW